MENISLATARHESLLELWRSRVMDCRNSGMTISEWCKEQEINVKTYYYWQKKVWDRATRSLKPESSVQFAQVNVSPYMGTPSDAEVIIRCNRMTVEIRNSVNPLLLNRILQMVNQNV